MEKRILAKCGRKKAKCGRKKAPFGTQEAAILTSAGITAAATAAAAKMSSDATKNAADAQADAQKSAAQKQADAITKQSDLAKQSQLESQEFIKEQNERNRQLQQDIQLQLQMLTGQQNNNDRLEASKLVVKNGGKTKSRFSLRGSYDGNNIPFKVTDGGYVVPVAKTPEGFNLFEIKGNDHEHYHKTSGGKNKTGVGIKFADGNVVEGEGNQNTNQGEYMLQTPDGAYFISKHNVAGFNPAKAVNEGMHPLMAFNIQEQQKYMNGITDSGKKISSPVKGNKKLAGGVIPTVYNMYNQTGPQLGVDTIGDTVVGSAYAVNHRKLACGGRHKKLAYGGRYKKLACGGRHKAFLGTDSDNNIISNKTTFINNNRRTLKCGGKVRRKARNGYWDWNTGSWVTDTPIESITVPYKPGIQPSTSAPSNSTTPVSTKSSSGNWLSNNANVIGAGLGALSNIGGALMSSNADRYAAKKLSEANTVAANMVADAYRNLQIIDPSSIRREDYVASHVMPTLQAPISQANAQIALVNRQLQRRLDNARKYSASSAGAQTRATNAEIDTQDAKNVIYAKDQEQMQKVRQENARRISEAALQNAQLDAEANKQYSDAYLNVLQYNNNIKNQRILGAANALSEGTVNSASAMANAATANSSVWNNAILNSAQGFGNTLSAMATRKADLEKVLLGASGEARSNYYSNSGSISDAKSYYDNLVRQYSLIENSDKPEDQDTKAYLKRLINNVAISRKFKTVQ